MGDDCDCWGWRSVSDVLVVVISRNVIVTNSIITNPRIVIMVFLHTSTSLYSH